MHDGALLTIGGAAACIHNRFLRRPPAVLPGRLHRRSCRLRNRERPRHVRRATAVPLLGIHHRGGSCHGRPPAYRRRICAGRRTAPAWHSSRAIRKSWTAAKGDGVFITTSGIGVIPPGVDIRPTNMRPGDVLLINGPDRTAWHRDHVRTRGTVVRARRSQATPPHCIRWSQRCSPLAPPFTSCVIPHGAVSRVR